jgi:hypothetical protein
MKKRTKKKKKNKNKISPPSIDTTQSTIAISPEMNCLTNEEFEEFALNIERVGMASPLNVQYPGIDGVLHFRLLSNNKEEWITAFVQYSISETHPFSPEAVITLESHIPKIEQTVKEKRIANHRTVLFSIGPKRKNPNCPDPEINTSLNRNIDHYYISKALNTLTTTQQQLRKGKEPQIKK